jgi:hypothetical protein
MSRSPSLELIDREVHAAPEQLPQSPFHAFTRYEPLQIRVRASGRVEKPTIRIGRPFVDAVSSDPKEIRGSRFQPVSEPGAGLRQVDRMTQERHQSADEAPG